MNKEHRLTNDEVNVISSMGIMTLLTGEAGKERWLTNDEVKKLQNKSEQLMSQMTSTGLLSIYMYVRNYKLRTADSH